MKTIPPWHNDVQEALAFLEQSRPEDCEIYLRRLLPQYENDTLCQAVCLDGLGQALFMLRKPNEALAALEQSLSLLREEAALAHDARPLLLGVLQNLSHAYMMVDQTEKSLTLGREAVHLAEQIFGADSPRLADALLSLSAAYYNGREFDAAENLLLRARTIWEAQSPVPPELGTCLNNLGRIYEERGQLAAGIALHRSAVALRQKILGDHTDTAFSLGNLGVSLASDGQWQEAAAILTEAVALYTRLGKGESPEAISYKKNLQNILLLPAACE